MWTWLATLIGGPVITGLINALQGQLDAANSRTGLRPIAAKEIEAEIEARKQEYLTRRNPAQAAAGLANRIRNLGYPVEIRAAA